jgi:hypothetical protein
VQIRPPRRLNGRRLSAHGKARAFGDSVGQELGAAEQRYYINLSQTLVPFATGTALDFLGRLFGVTRLQAVAPVVVSADQDLQF